MKNQIYKATHVLRSMQTEEERVRVFLRGQEQVRKTIILQYTTCTALLEELFSYAPDLSWEEDGVGCCDQDLTMAEDGICGPAAQSLIALRNAKVVKERLHRGGACIYHEPDAGCTLGIFKSPRCIAHQGEANLPKGYNYSYVRGTLEKILSGFDKTTLEVNPQSNEPLVDEFTGYLRALIAEARSARVLAQAATV